jgi:hypothetical protein
MQRFVGLPVLLAGLWIAGCSDGSTSQRTKVYKASGKVTFVGSPLIGAVVTFAPQENQPAAVARTNDAGEFALTTYGGNDGAAAGAFKVMIMLPESDSSGGIPQDAHGTDPAMVLPGSGHSAQAAKSKSSLLPVKYSDINQTPLTATVDPNGNNQFTFELK